MRSGRDAVARARSAVAESLSPSFAPKTAHADSPSVNGKQWSHHHGPGSEGGSSPGTPSAAFSSGGSHRQRRRPPAQHLTPLTPYSDENSPAGGGRSSPRQQSSASTVVYLRAGSSPRAGGFSPAASEPSLAEWGFSGFATYPGSAGPEELGGGGSPSPPRHPAWREAAEAAAGSGRLLRFAQLRGGSPPSASRGAERGHYQQHSGQFTHYGAGDQEYEHGYDSAEAEHWEEDLRLREQGDDTQGQLSDIDRDLGGPAAAAAPPALLEGDETAADGAESDGCGAGAGDEACSTVLSDDGGDCGASRGCGAAARAPSFASEAKEQHESQEEAQEEDDASEAESPLVRRAWGGGGSRAQQLLSARTAVVRSRGSVCAALSARRRARKGRRGGAAKAAAAEAAKATPAAPEASETAGAAAAAEVPRGAAQQEAALGETAEAAGCGVESSGRPLSLPSDAEEAAAAQEQCGPADAFRTPLFPVGRRIGGGAGGRRGSPSSPGCPEPLRCDGGCGSSCGGCASARSGGSTAGLCRASRQLARDLRAAEQLLSVVATAAAAEGHALDTLQVLSSRKHNVATDE